LNLQASLRLLGERIRKTRKAKGLSQEDLAYEAEVDRSYMGGIERGQRNPSLKTLCTIASTLNVDVGTLTRGLPVKR
jgi:transcriptional regulator with XRE-family HTH domain